MTISDMLNEAMKLDTDGILNEYDFEIIIKDIKNKCKEKE